MLEDLWLFDDLSGLLYTRDTNSGLRWIERRFWISRWNEKVTVLRIFQILAKPRNLIFSLARVEGQYLGDIVIGKSTKPVQMGIMRDVRPNTEGK